METLTEQRRHHRAELETPITLYCASGALKGNTGNLSYTGILIRLDGHLLPHPGENCKVVIHMPGDRVEALGEIVRVSRVHQECALDFTQLGKNGVLLLPLSPPL